MQHPMALNLVLITPARNEETHLEATAECMASQTVLPVRWLIVNDGSTDRTGDIARKYASDHPWIEVMDMPSHRDRSFAAKATCFNAGVERVRELQWDVIGNVDADISFEDDYLEFLLEKFALIPDLGVAGTTFREEGYDSAKDSFEGMKHVAGGCQLFRRKCFEEIGGYVPNKAGGVDWIAVTTARMRGWKTRSFREKFFFHHRSLGTAEQNSIAALYSYGQKDYYLGNHPLWELVRIGYRLAKKPAVVGGLAVALGYFGAAARRIRRPVSPQLMTFHRKEQMHKLALILSSLVKLQRPDKFLLMEE